MAKTATEKLEAKLNGIVRRMTGETVGEWGRLSWRLRCTPEELFAALDAAGGTTLDFDWKLHLDISHDDGTDVITELRVHRDILVRMARIYRESRCACGCGGSWDRAVRGTCENRPAVWMGCSRRSGSAVGCGISGSADEAMFRAAAESAERLGVSLDDMVEWSSRLEACRHHQRAEIERQIRDEA